jgi:asparagine synthase (glutamine-hydrolysing)
MCGLAGIFNYKNQGNPQHIRLLTDTMAHRGPDADGFYENGPIQLGHRRLSIIDLSEAANQPFIDNSKRYAIIFNGEIYNYTDIKRMLPGFAFRTNGDTEAVLAAYMQWGDDCLQHLRGMFAFAIWDNEQQQLFMARDRMGVKPLYYYKDDRWLVFASELRPLKKLLQKLLTIDVSAVRQYMQFQSFYAPGSLFNEIKQLPAAHYAVADISGKLSTAAYWDISKPTRQYEIGDKTTMQSELMNRLQTAVQRRMVSDVPVAAFLSGGIDSSVAVALMSQFSANPIHTFNVSFEEEAFSEAKYARIISKKFNTRHHEIQLKPTVLLDELENALDAMDSPSADGVNTYVVSGAVAKNGIKVAVSGVGGDELFAGYPFFKYFTAIRQKRSFFKLPSWLRQMAAPVLAKRMKVDATRMRNLLTVPQPEIEYLHPVFRTILTPQFIDTLLPSGNRDSAAAYLNGHAADVHRFPLLSQVSIAEYAGYTQQTLLKDADQMSMAHSLEVREPFFDTDLIEYVLQIPDAMKQSHTPKGLLVDTVGDLLPHEVVHRKKQGFVFPWELWLKQELKAFCDTHIRYAAETGWLQKEAVLQVWERFLKGDHTIKWTAPWQIAVLGYWLQRNN